MKREIIQELKYHFDDVSVSKDSVITVRRAFFYRHGGSSSDLVAKVKGMFPMAKIIDEGEIWKPFRGGASVRAQSHWYVKFRL